LGPTFITAQQTWQERVGQVRRKNEQYGDENFQCCVWLGNGAIKRPQRLKHGTTETRIATQATCSDGPATPRPSRIEEQALHIGQTLGAFLDGRWAVAAVLLERLMRLKKCGERTGIFTG
jgi:hypothetical protein